MAEGGISAGQAESIARSVAHQVVAPVQREVNELQSRIRELEAEMARVEGAIRDMHSSLRDGLSALRETNSDILKAQIATTAATTVGLTAVQQTNSSGFSKVSTDLNVVDSSLKQMSQALVQMEVIRQMHEVKTPAEQVERFQEEIEQRFSKAVENVNEVRRQYDAMQLRVADDLDKKLRHIGSHIYRVFEEDFEEFAEGPLSAPFDATIALALEVDLDAIERRAEALESTLASFDEGRLQPLLSAQSELEHLFASKYTVEGITEETCYVPVSICELQEGDRPLVRVLIDETPVATSGEVLTMSLKMSATGRAIAQRVDPLVRDRFNRFPKRPIRPDERSRLSAALWRLAEAGQIPAELLDGYILVLEQAELQLLDDGEVK